MASELASSPRARRCSPSPRHRELSHLTTKGVGGLLMLQLRRDSDFRRTPCRWMARGPGIRAPEGLGTAHCRGSDLMSTRALGDPPGPPPGGGTCTHGTLTFGSWARAPAHPSLFHGLLWGGPWPGVPAPPPPRAALGPQLRDLPSSSETPEAVDPPQSPLGSWCHCSPWKSGPSTVSPGDGRGPGLEKPDTM